MLLGNKLPGLLYLVPLSLINFQNRIVSPGPWHPVRAPGHGLPHSPGLAWVLQAGGQGPHGQWTWRHPRAPSRHRSPCVSAEPRGRAASGLRSPCPRLPRLSRAGLATWPLLRHLQGPRLPPAMALHICLPSPRLMVRLSQLDLPPLQSRPKALGLRTVSSSHVVCRWARAPRRWSAGHQPPARWTLALTQP